MDQRAPKLHGAFSNNLKVNSTFSQNPYKNVLNMLIKGKETPGRYAMVEVVFHNWIRKRLVGC